MQITTPLARRLVVWVVFISSMLAILATLLPSFLLSDFVFPVSNFPVILQWLSSILPATYFINILNGLYLRHLDLTHLWSSYLVLLTMSVILTMIAFIRLKKEGM